MATKTANERRLAAELKIVRTLVRTLLAAGFRITVFDGGEATVKKSRSERVIMPALRTTDEDRLVAWRDDCAGWVSLVYGNCPWEVISDYSTSLEPFMGAAEKVADAVEAALDR
jgi:hypothetical protein